MSAIRPSPLERAKDQITIPTLAATLFPGWKADRSCKSPFRPDRHASFSVFDDGRKFKDHATGDGGDVVDFLALARGSDKATAARELIAIAGTTGPTTRLPMSSPAPCPKLSTSAQDGAPRPSLPAMPEAVANVWHEGLDHLRHNTSLQHVIDRWRSWPAGTVAALVDHDLISSPLLDGRRGIAFPVQAPITDDLGLLGTRHVGFHHRHKPASGERPRWTYRPNEKIDGASVPALPFVIGAGFLPGATTVVVTEGQWDAVTLAAAAGWLAHDAAWPERISVVGTRGAGAWRSLIETWSAFWHPKAAFILFPDADPAGDSWTAPGGFASALAKRGHRVRIARSKDPEAKDLNAIHRKIQITPQAVSSWIAISRATTP